VLLDGVHRFRLQRPARLGGLGLSLHRVVPPAETEEALVPVIVAVHPVIDVGGFLPADPAS
jgi:hypothetical protein